MKLKLLLCAIVALFVTTSNITAQDINSKNVTFQYKPKEKISFDIYIEQDIMLTNWYKEKRFNDLYKNINSFNVGFRLNIRLFRNFGIYGDVSVGGYNGSYKESNRPHIFDNIDYNDFYTDRFDDTTTNPNFKMSGGFYYQFIHNKWRFIPMIGYGINSIPNNSFSWYLKKIDSNEAYIQMHSDTEIDETMSSLNLQFRTEYKLSNKFIVTSGISFSQMLNRMNNEITLKDAYTYEIINTWNKKTRFVNYLGINIGLSFR